jgi:hypothetical protein
LAVDSVPEEGCSLLRTGFMKETRVAIKEVKVNWNANQKLLRRKSTPKVEYLKVLIATIIEKFFKDSDEEAIEKIIRYGAIDPVIIHPLFAMDVAFRERFKNILYNCKTFKLLKLYRGEDIELRRNELVDAGTECLI